MTSTQATPAVRKNRDTSIFVGGIMGTTTEKEIRQYFSQFGPIYSVTVIPNKTNPSLNKGFCFISFKDSDTKKRALSVKNHFFLDRKITCSSLLKGPKLKEEIARNNSKKLCIKNVPKGMTEADFQTFFSTFGAIHSHYLVTYKNSKVPTHNGYLVFKDNEVFHRLLDLKFVSYQDTWMKIERYSKKESRFEFSENQKTDLSEESLELEVNHSVKPTRKLFQREETNGAHSGHHFSNLRFNLRV